MSLMTALMWRPSSWPICTMREASASASASVFMNRAAAGLDIEHDGIAPLAIF
ncbi:hypothetical protein [Candidatus Amarolinea dominans]|uniref:hypothetical protein n=1 Tax=Candidatus Amarolinea dominans TaxID=3140696 RepID=UPI0031CC9020